MKLVFTPKYNIEFKDQNINCIKAIRDIYSNVSRVINLQIQKLLGNIPNEQQQFQDTRF